MPGGGKSLAGKIIVVTGSAYGIGKAISEQCSSEGGIVVIADLADHETASEATVDRLKQQNCEAMFVACDVSNETQVRRLMATVVGKFGRIDVLFCNAGIPGQGGLLHEASLENFQNVLGVNLIGVFLCCKYALQHMIKRRDGVIISTASTFGMIGAKGASAYCASKGGVINLTRTLAKEYGPYGIRVNAICPGYIDNDMARRRQQMLAADAAAVVQKREREAALQPAGRQGSTAEVASVAAFLASSAASFMTGAIVPVDGGCTATFNSGSS